MSTALGVAGIFLFLLVVVGIGCYLLMAFGIQKMLKTLHYDKTWMAWIPLANLFAIAQVASRGQDEMKIFNFQLPTVVMGLWWIVYFVLGRIPHVGTLLATACQVICLGTCFINIYAMLDGKSEEEEKAIGFVSGLIPIIAVIKFLCYQGPELDYHSQPEM